MIVCGMELAGSQAIIVVLEGTKADFRYLDVTPRKLTIADHEKQDEVRAFKDAAHSLFRENRIDRVAIKKRAARGNFAGGPVGFKLEGAIQLFEGCPVDLIAGPTIAAVQRNYSPSVPTDINKYQLAAFEVAFAALPRD